MVFCCLGLKLSLKPTWAMDDYVFCCSFPESFTSIMVGHSVDESASTPSQSSSTQQSTTLHLDPNHLTPGASVSAESLPSVCDGMDFVFYFLIM